MKRIGVELKNCHHSTFFVVEVNDAQLELVQRLAALSAAASTGDCQPVLVLRAAEDVEAELRIEPST